MKKPKPNLNLNLNLNPDISPPKNETEKHFLLKNIAASLLKYRFQCCYAATEVEIGKSYDDNLKKEWKTSTSNSKEKRPPFKWGARKVTDACGIKLEYQRYKTKKTTTTVRSIEAKVSKPDLENGYCISGDYNYIIAPKGLFKKSDILNFVGLIEVDFENLKWKNGFEKIEGVNITSNPSRVNSDIRKNRNAWIKALVDKMLRGYTNEKVFRGKWFYPGYNV